MTATCESDPVAAFILRHEGPVSTLMIAGWVSLIGLISYAAAAHWGWSFAALLLAAAGYRRAVLHLTRRARALRGTRP